jgi:SNF2 family DNA or RNA helicase
MVFHKVLLIAEFNNPIPLTNFDIISIETSQIGRYNKMLIYKANQNDDILYFSFYPTTLVELYTFIEILNGKSNKDNKKSNNGKIGNLKGTILWNLTYEIEDMKYIGYNQKYKSNIMLNINPNEELISEYFNSSIALNSYFTNKYDELPLFDIKDFSSKSFISYDSPIEIPNFKVSLFDYQKRSLNKMLTIEQGAIDLKIKYTIDILLNNNEYIYDPILNKCVNKDKYLTLKINGGILADEMGLGKTITCISLITKNPALNDHPKLKYSESYKMNKIFSKATLILCPSHLTKQWLTEIKKCNKDCKVVSVLTKKDMEKMKIADIINADIIIVSHQFLMNFKYYPTLYYKTCTASSFNQDSRQQQIKNKLITLISSSDFINSEIETPLFEFFFFQRMILDEGHEIFGEMLSNHSLSKYMSEWVSSIDANYYWYVSGTPFINFNGVKNSSRFIKLSLNENKKKIKYDFSSKINNYITKELFDFNEKSYIWKNILEKICIRHRKCDIENQIQILGYDEKLIWVKFTELEKQLYSVKKGKVTKEYLQQLCCHPMIIDASRKIFGNIEVDLSIMQDKLIIHHKQNYETYKNKIEKLVPTRHEYHMLKKTYETSMHESFYLYTLLDKLKNKPIDENDNCSICMDVLDNPTLTTCGHLYCYECLKMCLNEKNKCPTCKADLSGKDLLLVSGKPKSSNEENPLISKYGSKLGKTISIIRSLVALEHTRIIIFSQWDDMLYLIGKTLQENGISNSFVKGNVWARNGAISKFKAGKNNEGNDNKVIMLSLKNSASGTNLTEATHIIFIEPINASKEECNAIEGQAIARACRIGQKNKINIIRILIEDTIEEEIYKKNYNENVIIEFKNDNILLNELTPNTMVI